MSETPATYTWNLADDTCGFQPLPKSRLSSFIRSRTCAQILDESGVPPEGISLYCLSDPRDIRAVKYIGQTASPRRRYLQHVGTARLWMPDEVPWWVKSPRLRPLYDWIRALHREEYRLPFMVVTRRVEGVSEARQVERALILDAIRQEIPILNVEAGTTAKKNSARSRARSTRRPGIQRR